MLLGTILFALLPVALLVMGVFSIIHPEQVGLGFCRLGKANWKATTFGLTDMHWFYREEKARRIGIQIGAMFCLFGLILGIFFVLSICGPDSFAATAQAQSYLQQKYGSAQRHSSFWTKDAPDKPNSVLIHYRYGEKTGDLQATWNGTNYIITEVTPPQG
jgi:hypothetical protein